MYVLVLPLHMIDVYFPQLLAANRTLCLLMPVGDTILVTICNLNIALLTIDRYIAIVHPFAYVAHGNSLPFLRWLLAVIWIYSFIVGNLHFLYNKWASSGHCITSLIMQPIINRICVVPIVLFNATLIITAYTHIFLVIRRHNHQIGLQATNSEQVNINISMLKC